MCPVCSHCGGELFKLVVQLFTTLCKQTNKHDTAALSSVVLLRLDCGRVFSRVCVCVFSELWPRISPAGNETIRMIVVVDLKACLLVFWSKGQDGRMVTTVRNVYFIKH